MNRKEEYPENIGVKIRIVSLEDAEQLLDIYTPYVENTAITFEYEVPGIEEFKRRMLCVLEKYPWIAAEQGGKILGYAYAGTFKERAAYEWAVETSIYVSAEQRRAGIGRLLYGALERILAAQNILNLNACIAYSEEESMYLPQDSVRFHENMGYHLAARFHKCGYKLGRWYDMIWMEKHIGRHTEHPKEVRRFSDMNEQELECLCNMSFL